MARTTPSSIACEAPWIDVGRKGWAESPRRRRCPLGEMNVGNNGRVMTGKSVTVGVLATCESSHQHGTGLFQDWGLYNSPANWTPPVE